MVIINLKLSFMKTETIKGSKYSMLINSKLQVKQELTVSHKLSLIIQITCLFYQVILLRVIQDIKLEMQQRLAL